MLKNMLNIKGIKELDKKAQQATQGGFVLICEDICLGGLRLCYRNKTEIVYVPC
jgi:hypothetical protein